MTDPPMARKPIIQIPCFDEADTLPIALKELPRRVDGFDAVEWLVVDDGSSDDTAGVALRHGVDHVVRLSRHQGLARAFTAGLEASLAAGASVIVNTDADNQYRAEDIPALVAPIVESRAQIVIGARPIEEIEDFSIPAALLVAVGTAINLRFLYFWLTDGGAGHLQSLILATILIASGTSLFVVALVADLIATNRRLLEQIDWRMRRLADADRSRDARSERR